MQRAGWHLPRHVLCGLTAEEMQLSPTILGSIAPTQHMETSAPLKVLGHRSAMIGVHASPSAHKPDFLVQQWNISPRADAIRGGSPLIAEMHTFGTFLRGAAEEPSIVWQYRGPQRRHLPS